MRKRFVKHGNSAAVIIEKPIMELLHMNLDTVLEISTDGTRLIIEPSGADMHRSDVEDALERGRAKYGRMLRNLGQ